MEKTKFSSTDNKMKKLKKKTKISFLYQKEDFNPTTRWLKVRKRISNKTLESRLAAIPMDLKKLFRLKILMMRWRV
jgi:hypothetical protein